MSEETERAVYIQRLDPDERDAYVDAHDDVPEGVTDAMERGGVEMFELYIRDDIAVCILECADLDTYLDAVDGDAAVAEWERYTGQEGVIESISYRDDRASWIVSTFVVGDRNDEPQTQRKEDLRSCMDAASGAQRPETAVLDRVVGSFGLRSAVVRLL